MRTYVFLFWRLLHLTILQISFFQKIRFFFENFLYIVWKFQKLFISLHCNLNQSLKNKKEVMKLITNFKDYYDYVIGTYGVDERIVYYRKNSNCKHNWYAKNQLSSYMFAIAGKLYCCFYYNGKFHFGKTLSVEDVHLSKFDKYRFELRQSLHDTPTDLNHKHNCPILRLNIDWDGNFDVIEENPKLEYFQFGKFITAEEIYTQIINFLGEEKPFQDNRTDTDKILSNGFDLKTSFRD